MPLFGKKPGPPPVPSVELPPGEEVERAVAATLLQGKNAMRGTLFMTNRRLVFEAKKGDARWMVVPFADVKSAGLFPWHGAPMGPSSRNQCLVVVTADDEQVWWDFGARDEREWLPLVQQKADAAREAAAPGG